MPLNPTQQQSESHAAVKVSNKAVRSPADHSNEKLRTQHYLIPSSCLHLFQRPSEPQLRAIELLSRCTFRVAADPLLGDSARLSLHYREGCSDPSVGERLLNGLLTQRGASLQPVRLGLPPRASSSNPVACAIGLVAEDLLRGSTFVHCCGLAYTAFAQLQPASPAAANSPGGPSNPSASAAVRVCNRLQLLLLSEQAVTFIPTHTEAGIAALVIEPSVTSLASVAPSALLTVGWGLCGFRYNGGDETASVLHSFPPLGAMRIAAHVAADAFAALTPLRIALAESPEDFAVARSPPLPAVRAARLCENHELPPLLGFPHLNPDAAVPAHLLKPPPPQVFDLFYTGGSHFRPSVDPRQHRMRLEFQESQQRNQQRFGCDFLGDSVSVGSSEMLTPF